MSRHRILEYTRVAVVAVQDVANTTGTPFLHSVCSLTLSIILMVEEKTFHMEHCIRIVELVHDFLCALISVCTAPEVLASPKLLDHIREYAEALHKVRICLKTQQGMGKMKRILKKNHTGVELEACEAELNEVLGKFKINFGTYMVEKLTELDKDTARRHQELLELLSSQTGSLDDASSIGRDAFSASSRSFSLLPASPKSFHGRDSELDQVLETLLKDSPRVAILGPGGMGKTTLAMAALHHPAITERYAVRHFISCESAKTNSDLIRAIGLHLSIEPTSDYSKIILNSLRECGRCILVLDNFETPWESLGSRGAVEDFLSLLSEISTMALIVTMRGAERPERVKWTRPFLPPLEPVSLSATRQIFIEVADEPQADDHQALEELLEASGSLPLVASLMANVAAFEGYSATLARWKDESTALLSDGYDKGSSLEISITMSLTSPRMSNSPYAKDLLSLLAFLPDGMTHEELRASKVPIPNIFHQSSILVRMSLAYLGEKQRLKILNPIAEYIRRAEAPSASITRPVRQYFQSLLSLSMSGLRYSPGTLVPRIASHLGNIHAIILQGVSDNKQSLSEIGHSIIELNNVSQIMLHGQSPLFQEVPSLITATGDLDLQAKYIFARLTDHSLSNEEADKLIAGANETLQTVQMPIVTVMTLYRAFARYNTRHDMQKAIRFSDLTLSLTERTTNTKELFLALDTRLEILYSLNDGYKMLEKINRSRQAGMPSFDLELALTEATAQVFIGNLPAALKLSSEIREELDSVSLGGSDRRLTLLDLEADIHEKKTEYVEAYKIYETIAKKTSPSRSYRFHAFALSRMAYCDIRMRGNEADIMQNLKSCKETYEAQGRSPAASYSVVLATVHLYYYGDTDGARRELEKVVQARGSSGVIRLECLSLLGDLKNGMYSIPDSFRWSMVCLAFSWQKKDSIRTLHALRCVASVFAAWDEDEQDAALTLFYTALEGGTARDIHRLRADCMLGIGDVMKQRGDLVAAKKMWEAAHPLFLRSSQTKDAAAVEMRLEELKSPSQETQVVHQPPRIPIFEA